MNLTPQRTASPLPSTIGRYRVVGRLGKGAMGIVYSAYDDVMDRPVAIKVMMADVEDDPETSARFYREAHAAGQLVHRNIITIFDMGDENGRPYIVMELVEGRTLAEYLKRPEGVLVEEKIALMVQLCKGLQLAHSKGIFHRDIKPGNLLISDDGSLKIVDFGIARTATSSMTMSGLIMGTPDYMSPEQARAGEVDERSDVFSAGAVFYYMLTGRKPFAAADLGAVLHKVQSEDPLPVRDTEAPPCLAPVAMKAMAKAPEARYQKAAFMMADLVRIERELSLEARKVSEDVRRDLGELETLASERHQLCAFWNVPPRAADIALFRKDLARRFPSVADWLDERGDDCWDWTSARDRREEVAAIRRDLEAEVAGLKQAAAALESGQKAAVRGDLTQALGYLDSAVQLMPSCERASDERIRILGLLAEQQAAQDRTRALVMEAERAANSAEWSTVLALTEQVLAADATNATAASLRVKATNAMISDARQLKQQCENALKRAEKLAHKRRFDEAEQAIAEAKRFDPASATAQALEVRVRNLRLEAERASELEREAAEIVAAARIRFEKGERTQALDDLRSFLVREPHSKGVASALATLTSEMESKNAEDRRRAEAADLAKTAEAAFNADDPGRALTLARQALGVDRNEPLARKIEGVATARLRERSLANERAQSAAKALQKARVLLARGKFSAARELAREAAQLRPEDEEPTALLATILENESNANETAKREEEARRCARAVAPILAMARVAEANHDLVRASWLAENALAIDVDCADARRIVETVRAKISEQPALADETVKLAGTSGPASDPDDTVTLSPANPTWRRLADRLNRNLPATLKDWFQR